MSTFRPRIASSIEARRSAIRSPFHDPNPDAWVEAISSCVRQGEVVRYPPMLAADYLTMRLDASKPAETDGAAV